MAARRLKRVARSVELPEAQYWELALSAGPPVNFASDAERKAVWRRHRHEIQTNPCTRPGAWWLYESPEPRTSEPEHLQLERMGRLAAEEKAFLAGWRAMGVFA